MKKSIYNPITVNSEISAIILFCEWRQKTCVMLKIRDICMLYLYQSTTERSRHFTRVLFSRNFAYAKFRENKTLEKISEFTVLCIFEPSVLSGVLKQDMLHAA